MKELTADKRKRVAEECGESHRFWAPQHRGQYWVALVTKIAELIESAKDREGYIGYHNLLKRFNKALATGNTAELEQICSELIEVKE